MVGVWLAVAHFAIDASGNLSSRLDDQRRVEYGKGLLRHSGARAHVHGRVWAGNIKHAQNARHILPIQPAVDRSGVHRLRGQRIHAAAPTFRRIQRTSGAQQAVSPGFPVEPPSVGTGKEKIIRIADGHILPHVARLSPQATRDDLAVKPSQAPLAVFDKASRQIVEQFRMARSLASQAQISRRADESAAYVVHPDPVDDHAGCQRIFWSDNGASQIQPSAGFRVDRLAAQHHRHPASHLLAHLGRIASQEDVALHRRFGIHQCHRSGWAAHRLGLMDRDRTQAFAKLGLFVPLGHSHRVVCGHNQRCAFRAQEGSQRYEFCGIISLQSLATGYLRSDSHHEPRVNFCQRPQCGGHRRSQFMKHQRMDFMLARRHKVSNARRHGRIGL